MSERLRRAIGNSSPTELAPAKNIGDQLRELAEPCDRSEKIHSIIERAARRCDIPKWRVFNLWYGKASRISDEERVQVASALEKKRREDAKRELHDLKLRIAALESRMRQADPDFFSVDLDGLGEAMRRPG